MLIEDSIVLITSSDPENRRFGTGFVVHCDEDNDYIMTCRHVVSAVSADVHKSVRCDYHEYFLLDIFMNHSDDDPDDMAIVKIQGKLGKPALRLGWVGRPGDKIRMLGYYLYSSNPDAHRQLPVDGELGERGILNFRSRKGCVVTWDLEIEGRRILQEGYSGSPVILGDAVIGMVSHKLCKGQVGVAISIDALPAVWPDAPLEPAQKIVEERINPSEEKPGPPEEQRPGKKQQAYGRLLALLCDREEHDDLFEDEFSRFCADNACKNAPQFFIVHGDVGEAHRSLVARFIRTHILTHARERMAREAHRDREDEALFEIKPKWVAKTDLAAHKQALQRRLINAVNRSYTQRDYSLERLLSFPQIDKYGVVLVHHYIGPGDWTAHCRDLLKWYMTEYWRLGPAETDALFIVFFCIEYPKAEPGKKWFFFPNRGLKARTSIRAQLASLADEVKESCRCVLIDELGPVTREQAADWFREYTDFNDFEIEQNLQDLFKDAETLPMSVVEHRLEKIADKINNQAFQQYIGGNPL